MPAFDPYAECPCGSGEKYKWCCQKVEAIAEREARMTESGQPDAALKILTEGLRQHPDSPWLTLRKAVLLARRNEIDPAKDLLRKLIARRPRHLGALELLVKLALISEGPRNAAGYLQQALTALPADRRRGFARVASEVAEALAELGAVPAAIAHFQLSTRLDPEAAPSSSWAIRELERDAETSPWLRNPYRLSPVPPGLDPTRQARFEQALKWAEEGLWASAAAAFDTLSAESTPESDRNLGLCRLWLFDHSGAVQALRRYTRWVGESEANVDLEALCQLIEPVRENDRVELIQWIWSLRHRDRLLQALQAEPRVFAAGTTPIDPSDPASFQVEQFLLLDRPPAPADSSVEPDSIPRVEGRLLVGQEIVALEAYDDGRLDRLAEWLRSFAGDALPPAHPRTKVLGSASRHALAMRSEWLLPEKLSGPEAEALSQRQRRRILEEIWPNLPHPALNGLTPRQAASDPALRVPLRAALVLLESTAHPGDSNPPNLRAELGIPPEPPIPADTEIDAVHIGRLHLLDPSQLTNPKLVQYFHRAYRYALTAALEQAARILDQRPELLDVEGGVSRVQVYQALCSIALEQRRPDDAIAWIEKGRRGDLGPQREANLVHWELLEIRARAATEPPDRWVPLLAATLDRYRDQEETQRTIFLSLVGLGLVRTMPSPDRPGELLIDTRPLQELLARYGPRITTARGELGISATRSPIWTPGSETSSGSTGGIWTPGQPTTSSAHGPAADKPRLIIPGH
ncbi:MAG: protein disulfide-isomerase [Isosphaeraceae bacterium]|jgi:tetratricopeptide (TPR) repeat protein|nr:MAG: protein disulfide-isomerase [Isosphaeraceae bacterium]